MLWFPEEKHLTLDLTDVTMHFTGYRMDENEPDSKSLQIQFSRNPGPRPGQRGGRR